jgi:hypothetical protein
MEISMSFGQGMAAACQCAARNRSTLLQPDGFVV